MAERERQRSERKPSIRLKTAGVEAWFSSIQPRLRNPTDSLLDDSKAADHYEPGFDTYNPGWPGIGVGTDKLIPFAQNFRQRSRWKWIVVLYCCFSVLLLSSRLLLGFPPDLAHRNVVALGIYSQRSFTFCLDLFIRPSSFWSRIVPAADSPYRSSHIETYVVVS